MQDKATLRSGLSGIQGYTGAALSVLLFFFAPVETQSDKPWGLRGRAPSVIINLSADIRMASYPRRNCYGKECTSDFSKEIRNHYKVVEKSTYNPCANRRTCKHYGDICKPCKKRWGKDCKKCDSPCYTHCPDFEEQVCLKLKKPPYVCNGCDIRRGFAISSEELKRIDGIISPLIKQGQSVHQICVNNVDLIMLGVV